MPYLLSLWSIILAEWFFDSQFTFVRFLLFDQLGISISNVTIKVPTIGYDLQIVVEGSEFLFVLIM